MLAGMKEKVNNRDDIEEMIIGSMDVKSPSPSLLANQSTKIVTEVFMETDLIIEGVDGVKLESISPLTSQKMRSINLDSKNL